MKVKKPAVAGSFYPSKKEELFKLMDLLCGPPNDIKIDALGAMVPHAGYIYSGHTACSVYKALKPKKNVILMGPNHTGMGPNISIYDGDFWENSIGKVEINKALREKICEFYLCKEDELAHLHEHSLEVQLPFLQKYFESFSIVPIVIKFLSYDEAYSFGKHIGKLLDEESIVIISSDMSHYVSEEAAQKLDSFAFEAIKNLDTKALYERVLKYNLTMCGFLPAVVGIEALKEKGIKEVRVVEYTNSGMVNGDKDKVVSYLGLIFI